MLVKPSVHNDLLTYVEMVQLAFNFRYTATKGFEGPVFGSSDKWVGLGVFFDR